MTSPWGPEEVECEWSTRPFSKNQPHPVPNSYLTSLVPQARTATHMLKCLLISRKNLPSGTPLMVACSTGSQPLVSLSVAYLRCPGGSRCVCRYGLQHTNCGRATASSRVGSMVCMYVIVYFNPRPFLPSVPTWFALLRSESSSAVDQPIVLYNTRPSLFLLVSFHLSAGLPLHLHRTTPTYQSTILSGGWQFSEEALGLRQDGFSRTPIPPPGAAAYWQDVPRRERGVVGWSVLAFEAICHFSWWHPSGTELRQNHGWWHLPCMPPP